MLKCPHRKWIFFSHLACRGLPHHRLIWRGQVSWVQSPWTVDGHPIDGTEGRMGEVQVQASVRDITARALTKHKIQKMTEYTGPLTQ